KRGSDDSSYLVIFYRACRPPSLRVSSVRFLPSNSLASDASRDLYFAGGNGIGVLTHELGIFPQSVGNIPHERGSSRIKPEKIGVNPLNPRHPCSIKLYTDVKPALVSRALSSNSSFMHTPAHTSNAIPDARRRLSQVAE